MSKDNIIPLDKLEIIIWNRFFSRDADGTIHELMKLISDDRKAIQNEMLNKNKILSTENIKLKINCFLLKAKYFLLKI